MVGVDLDIYEEVCEERDKLEEQLTKAKEFLRHWVNSYGYIDVALCKQTDRFISEVEK